MAKKVAARRGQNLRDVAAAAGVGYGALREANPKVDPNLLVPGEEITISDKKTDKTAQAQSGGAKKVKGDRPPSVLRLRLRTAGGKALAGESGTIDFGGGRKPAEVKTDGAGKLEVVVPANLPQGVREAKLEIAGRRLVLRLSCLPPCTDSPGKLLIGAVRARLANLGYAVSEGDGPPDPAFHVALATFQADAKLPIDGKPSTSTLGKLKEVHGC